MLNAQILRIDDIAIAFDGDSMRYVINVVLFSGRAQYIGHIDAATKDEADTTYILLHHIVEQFGMHVDDVAQTAAVVTLGQRTLICDRV